ncbi:MAG: transglutaminase-like domain-containing protein [Nanoarchaeota archaeon]
MNINFTQKELKVINQLDNPKKVREFLLKEVVYDFNKRKETNRSFRRVLRDRKAHCLEGTLFTAAVLMQHGYTPLMISIEARDIDHNIFAYKEDGKFGSVAISRDENLRGRETKFRTIKDLVMSYYPYYWNYWTKDHEDLTLRGYAKVNLGIFKQDWITNEEDLDFIEDYLWEMKYRRLFPKNDDDLFYICNRDGKIKNVK